MIKGIQNKLAKLLSMPGVTYLILAIAILVRCIQLIFFYNMGTDNSYLFLATQALVSGNGFTLPYVPSNDLSSTFHEPMIMWPPGYSFVLSPVYLLLNKNYIVTGILVDAIFATLLIVYARKILHLFSIPIYLVNVFTLFTAFFTYFFYYHPSTDSIAISVYIIAVYYSFHALKNNSHWIRNGIMISVCLISCGLLKYLFIPPAFVPSIFLLILGIFKKHKNLTLLGLCSFLALFIGMLSLYFYQKNVSGSAGYISAQGRGLYLENLKAYHPYYLFSFIREETLSMITGIETITFHKAFKILHIILFIINIMVLFYLIFKKGINKLNLHEQFFLLASGIIITITLLLASLSLVVEKELILDRMLWTYIQEARYYGLITVLLHLNFFIFFQKHHRKLLFRSFLIGCMFLLFFEFCRGIVFVKNRIQLFGKEEYSWKKDLRIQRFADGLIQEYKNKYSVENVVVGSSEEFYRNRVSLYNQISMLKDEKLLNNQEVLKSSKSTLLLVIIKADDQHKYKEFLKKNQDKLIGRFEKYSFYSLLIQPAS